MNRAKKAFRLAKRVVSKVFIEAVLRMTPKRLKNRTLITCQRDDGGGAQIHGRLSAYAFSKYFQIGFVNSPILGAHFADGPDWDKRWNEMIGFPSLEQDSEKLGFPASERFVRNGVGVALYMLGKSFKRDAQPTTLIVQETHDWTDATPKFLESLNLAFQEILRSPVGSRAGGIVIHVRGGDDSTASIRKVEPSETELLCLSLLNKFPNLPLTIYSNAPVRLSAAVSSLCKIDLDSTPFFAIGHMKNADVLVVAKSSMSYVAGLACEGIVYAPEFWHPRLPSWTNLKSLI